MGVKNLAMTVKNYIVGAFSSNALAATANYFFTSLRPIMISLTRSSATTRMMFG